MLGVLEGVVMELQDCALHLLNSECLNLPSRCPPSRCPAISSYIEPDVFLCRDKLTVSYCGYVFDGNL